MKKRIAVASAALWVFLAYSASAQTYGPGTGGSIPDNNAAGVSSIINVADDRIIDSFNSLTVTGLNHTWVGDLVATISHGGVTVDLLDRLGATTSGSFGSNGGLLTGSYTFALGGTAFPTSGNISPGTYAPYANGTAGQSTTNTATFSNFAGLNTSSGWTLNISDRASGDTGSFTGWNFNVTSHVAGPPPLGTYTGGAGGNIPDGTGSAFQSTINVADNFTVAGFNSITMTGLSHTLVGDLSAQLTHNGITVDLFSRPGKTTTDPFDYGYDSNLNGNYTFALSGLDFVNAASQGNTSNTLASGTYAASTSQIPGAANPNTLSSFVGQNVNGGWTLNIIDASAGDVGTLTSWSFSVAPTPAPPGVVSAGLGLLSVGLGALRRRAITKKSLIS